MILKFIFDKYNIRLYNMVHIIFANLHGLTKRYFLFVILSLLINIVLSLNIC